MALTIKGAISPIIPRVPKSSSRHFIFHRNIFWVMFAIRFHPSHQLFSRLKNHNTFSLTIPLGDYVRLMRISRNFIIASPDVNKIKGVAERALQGTVPKVAKGMSRRLLLWFIILWYQYLCICRSFRYLQGEAVDCLGEQSMEQILYNRLFDLIQVTLVHQTSKIL